MKKRYVCVLFGGVSLEHTISLRSAETVLNLLDTEKYTLLPVGITQRGQWYLYGSRDYSKIPSGDWENCAENIPVILSPVRGQGLLCFEKSGIRSRNIDVVFPVLHGANGEDGAIQGLLQLAGIPCAGSGICASAIAMDKICSKIAAQQTGVRQAAWQTIERRELADHLNATVERVEQMLAYPMFVKPARGGSSVGVSKAWNRESIIGALHLAAEYDDKILVEEEIQGREVEVAVLGNDDPVASVCGEIDPGAAFYDYASKYLTDTSVAYIPARISEAAAEQVRDAAVRIYQTIGCRGLARVDFFVTGDQRVIFNEINTLPGFTSISMYPRLFEASGISCPQLLDRLLMLAMEENQ